RFAWTIEDAALWERSLAFLAPAAATAVFFGLHALVDAWMRSRRPVGPAAEALRSVLAWTAMESGSERLPFRHATYLGVTQWSLPTAQLAAWIGLTGLSGLIIACNAYVAHRLVSRQRPVPAPTFGRRRGARRVARAIAYGVILAVGAAALGRLPKP